MQIEIYLFISNLSFGFFFVSYCLSHKLTWLEVVRAATLTYSSCQGKAFISPINLLLKVKAAHLCPTHSCPTLCDTIDYTVHGILWAWILEWVAFPFWRGSFQPRDQTQVSHIAGRFFTSWTTMEVQEYWSG